MSFLSRGGVLSGRDGALMRRGALGRSLTSRKGGVVLTFAFTFNGVPFTFGDVSYTYGAA